MPDFDTGESAQQAFSKAVTTVVKGPKPMIERPIIGEHLCKCGCGTKLYGVHTVARGHKKRLKKSDAIVVAQPVKSKGYEIFDRSKATRVSIKRSVTHSQEMTVSEAHEMGRQVTIIVPRAQPSTQVKLTPELAQAIWRSLSKEQRYDIMGVEDLWNEAYDDELRMSTMNKVLLINEDNQSD
jgi:hypothetical protein